MNYAFVCSDCGAGYEHPHHPENPCPLCGGRLRRDWRHVSVRRDMAPHFNHSLGAYVRNRTEFEDGLKRKSDETSERLGVEHRFRPVDHDCVGATTEGLEDATWKAERDSGKTEPKRRFFP
jgi:DNA-directed RNA polymerase subunit RPC12/RpoP